MPLGPFFPDDGVRRERSRFRASFRPHSVTVKHILPVRDAIGLRSATQVAVREGVRVKYEQTLAKLLADGGPDPTFAEQIATTRAAHAMTTVNVVELLANREAAGSPAALALERHLGRAERRWAGA